MANPSDTNDSANYGLAIGFVYIFNMIVGTGALTMPKAFGYSGVILSSILVVFLSFISFITGTFIFEAMSIANAIKSAGNLEEDNPSNSSSSNKTITTSIQHGHVNPASDFAPESEIEAAVSNAYESDIDIVENRAGNADFERRIANKLFTIKNKYEMGEMADMFFNNMGKFFFYVAMILYLYGDLAIYNAAVPKSLRDTLCTFSFNANQTNETLTESDPCWTNTPSLSRMNVYRLFVLSFNLLIGPLVFYNLQKTKFLQLATTIMRWLAFITMIALALIKINDNASNPSPIVPPIKPSFFEIKGVPNFFGVCIYAFMCHHSLPSIITPMKRKDRFISIFMGAYLCILAFYLLLSYTAVFAFGDALDDFYTLNFLPKSSQQTIQSVFTQVIDYYLSLFPVFTISASFPIVAITLRNNLRSLYTFIGFTGPKRIERGESSVQLTALSPPSPSHFFPNVVIPLITIIPPMCISLITHDLQLLVGITGSYAGVAIQYIVPSCLVYFGRREAIRVFRQNYQLKHSFVSPFKHKYWVFFVLLWSNVSVIFVTMNHIINT